MKTCAHCGKTWPKRDDEPESYWSACSTECSDAWDAAHPEEAAKWTKVGDLSLADHAELRAMLGEGGKA